MHKQVAKLLVIQEKDITMMSLEEEKGQFPLALEEAEAQLAAAEESLAGAHEGLKDFKVKMKEFEIESDSLQSTIDKYNTQSIAIKTNRDYQALQKEITDKKIEKSRVEDRTIEVMEQIEEGEKTAVDCEAAVRAAKEHLEAERKKAAAETVRIEARIGVIAAERDAMLPDVDDHVLKRYRRILLNKKDKAVVPLLDRSCGGCFMQLPPIARVNVRKKDELVICDNCARILYWPEGVEQSGKAGEQPAGEAGETPSVVGEGA